MSTIDSLLKDMGEKLKETLDGLPEGDVSLGNLNKIWKERVKQKDCGKEEYLAVERIIEKFINQKKDFGEAYHKLGNVYYRRKFYEEAKRNYKKALGIEEWFLFGIKATFENDLNNSNIPKNLEAIFKTKGFPISETATVTEEKEGRWKLTDGEKIYNLKKEDGWINIYREDTQDKAWCYHDLGYLLYGARKYEEAIDNYEEAIDIAPKNWFYNDLGTALMKLGRYEDAEMAFMKALDLPYLFSINEKLEKDLKDATISEGLKSEFKNNGFSLSNTPIKITDNGWEIDSNKKKFIVKKENEKLNVYDKQKKDKDKAYVYNALGRLYYRKGRYEKARKKLEQAKEHNPDLDKVYNNLGLLDLEKGSYENAKNHFQKAIEMDKSEKKECENHAEAHLNLGDVFFSKGKFDEAEKEYTEAIRIDRNSAEAYYSLGNSAAKKKEKENAEKLYGEALRINPDYTKARKALEALDLPKEAGVDWWSWWFRGSEKWQHGRKPTGTLLIIALFCIIGIIGFITLMSLVGTIMPLGNVTYEHKNDTTFSYQKITIENSFSVDAKFENDLNNQSISKELENIFKTKGFSISESKNATVTKEKDNKWVIADGEKIYIVEKVDERLIIYKGSIEEIEKKITKTFSNATTPRTGTLPSSSIWTLIGLAVFIFIILSFPQLKKGSVSIGEFKFEVETKDAGTSDIGK
jgi:tetratricopeptide (TPR) repeat protein